MFITLYAFLAWRCSVCSTAVRRDSPHNPGVDELFAIISADGALLEMQSQQSRHNETDAVQTIHPKYEATFAGSMGTTFRDKSICVTRLINSLCESAGVDDRLSAIIEEDEAAIIEEEEDDRRHLAAQAEQERELAKRKLERKLAELIARALLKKGACAGEANEHYKGIAYVAKGQNGKVYSATSNRDGRMVAVKEIYSDLASFNILEVEPPRLHVPHNSEILEVYVHQELDISGYYHVALPNNSYGRTQSLTQSGNQGYNTNKEWTYTVSGNEVSIHESGNTGIISGWAGSYVIKWSKGIVYRQQQDCFVGIWRTERKEIRITRHQGEDGDDYVVEGYVNNTIICKVGQWNSEPIKLLKTLGKHTDGTITWTDFRNSSRSEWKKVRSPPPRIWLVYVYYPKGDLKTFLATHLRKERDHWGDQTIQLGALDIHLFARQIAFGLYLLHVHGFLHRDLKPANIMVFLDPGAEDYELSRHKLVITDYGTVVPCSEENPKCASGITGTPYYMPKAQIEGRENYGPEVDWHAFGVILYQLALGLDAHPFKKPEEDNAKCEENIKQRKPNLDPIREKSENLYDLMSLLLTEKVNQIESGMWWGGTRHHPVWSHRYWITEPNTQAIKYSGHKGTEEFWKAVCAQSVAQGIAFPSERVDFKKLGPEVEKRCANPLAAREAVELCQH